MTRATDTETAPIGFRDQGKSCSLANLNSTGIGDYEKEARTPVLEAMPQYAHSRRNRHEIYTLIDEMLADLICNYFLKKNQISYQKMWRTKKFRSFVATTS